MAQVDKISYLPLLFWFIILFLAIYIHIGFFFIPKTFGAIKARGLYLKKLYKRFRRFYRQFKYNLWCLGRIELTELAYVASSLNFSISRLLSLK